MVLPSARMDVEGGKVLAAIVCHVQDSMTCLGWRDTAHTCRMLYRLPGSPVEDARAGTLHHALRLAASLRTLNVQWTTRTRLSPTHTHTHTHTHPHPRAPARTHECIHKRNTVVPLSRAQVFEKVAQDNPTTPQSFLDIGTCLLNIGNTVTTDQSVAAYTHSLASFTQVGEYM